MLVTGVSINVGCWRGHRLRTLISLVETGPGPTLTLAQAMVWVQLCQDLGLAAAGLGESRL